MPLWEKKWKFNYSGQEVTLLHFTHYSLRTSAALRVDSVEVRRTPKAYRFGVLDLDHAAIIDEESIKIKCSVWYGRKGVSLRHRVLKNGVLIHGEQDIDDFYADYLPDRSFSWYFLNRGAASGAAFTVAMAIMGQVTGMVSAVFLFSFFSCSTGLFFFLLSKLRKDNNSSGA